MKDKLIHIIAALALTGIISGAGAYVKVHVIENDITWIKQGIGEIKTMMKANKCGG